MAANNLYTLLNFKLPFLSRSFASDKRLGQKLDADAIINAVQNDPLSAELAYQFKGSHFPCFPLHQAIMLRAPMNILDVLCTPTSLNATYRGETALHLALRFHSTDVAVTLLERQPEAAQEKNRRGEMPLHVASSYRTPIEVVSALIDAHPGALMEKIGGHDAVAGSTPLHLACTRDAPLELVALLLERWPGALEEKDSRGRTPLHLARTSKVRSLILDKCPGALKVRNNDGDTPLHIACRQCYITLGEIFVLLEKWPEAIRQTNNHGKTPLHLATETRRSRRTLDVEKVFICTSVLCGEERSHPTLPEIVKFFVRIKWWNGILLLLNKHPSFVQTLDLDTKIKTDLLSMVGRKCKLTTMWELVRNEQDLLADI